MNPTMRDRLLTLVAGAAATSPLLCSVAQADPVYGVGLSGRSEYSTNPFLTDVAKAEALRVDISVEPFLRIESARTNLRVGATLTRSEYSRIYKSSTDYSLQADVSRTLSSRANLRGGLGFSSSSTGDYRPQSVDITGNPSPLPNVTDITLVGFQDRRNSFRGALGVGYTISSRDSLSLDYSAVIIGQPNSPIINGVKQGEYTSISQNFGYSRVINARLNVGASVGVSRTNFYKTRLGDSTVITPNLTGSWRLPGRFTVSGSVGMSILRQITFFGPDTSRNLAGSLSVCRNDTRDQFCFSGSRDVSPSSLGSTRKTLSLGSTYSYRLSSRDTLSFSGNYVQSDEPFAGPVPKVTYVTGGMNFKRAFSGRLGLDVGAGFKSSNFNSRRSDANVAIGISYLLGDRR
jgi:hypothetical protein